MWESLRTRKFRTSFSEKRKSIKIFFNPAIHKLIKPTLVTVFTLSQTFRKTSKNFSLRNTARTKKIGGAYA